MMVGEWPGWKYLHEGFHCDPLLHRKLGQASIGGLVSATQAKDLGYFPLSN